MNLYLDYSEKNNFSLTIILIIINLITNKNSFYIKEQEIGYNREE